MSHSEYFDRLTALLKEVGLKQDKILTEVGELCEEVLIQNRALEQMQSSLTRSLAHITATKSEVTELLQETTNLVELLAAENREKLWMTSILDLLTKP